MTTKKQRREAVSIVAKKREGAMSEEFKRAARKMMTKYEEVMEEAGFLPAPKKQTTMTPLQRQVHTFDDAVGKMSMDEIRSYCDNNL